MCCVCTRARRLNICFVSEATDEPTIPPDILPLVDDESGADVYAGVDKAATPAERPSNPEALSRDLDRARPLLLLPQRDSDANKEVMASRAHAWDQVTQMTIATSSSLIKQFLTTYLPRVFHLALPYLVGGPDFPRQPRPRRCVDRDSPDLTLGAWNAMIASNCLSQLRWDWDLVPGAWSLHFASEVNTGLSLSLKRAMKRGGADHVTDSDLHRHTTKIYQKLWDGEYVDNAGRRVPVKGDVSKISRIIGLTKEEKALVSNFHFMSARLAGTRQMRRHIGHIVKSSLIIYGCPVFMTVTPSERHSGLCIRLMRIRRRDPAVTTGVGQQFRDWIGHDRPSLYPKGHADAEEVVDIDMPEYDLRRAMTGRDPLSCVLAFGVFVKHVLPSLYGWRMCPNCPDCATGDNPCMNIYGSNATPMGGSLGRVDAAVGAFEAQKAEGVLHLHMFLFPQMAHQYLTLPQLADRIRQGLLSADAFKTYVSAARCAEYPDNNVFKEERATIERTWPAFADDMSLSRPPAWACNLAPPCTVLSDTMADEGLEWNALYKKRLQHALSRMNHHIHPLCSPGDDMETGERRPLSSCTTKAKPKLCRGNFPLDNEMTDVPSNRL